MSRLQAVFLISFLTTAALLAQVAGRLTGRVVDPTGAAVPDATVSLSLPGGKIAVLSTKTSSEGSFNLAAVRPDIYDLTVEAPGFSKTSAKGIRVDPNKETDVPPVKLDIISSSQTVEVIENAGAVQTTSPDVVSTLTQAQIENLPAINRQVSALFITQAGVTGNRTSTSINGLRPSYTNLLLDGINIQDSVRTNPLDYVPNRLTIGQVAEMTVGTSNLDPTIGGNATTISLTTPSGTNQFHGNAYWYNRNSAVSANDWFNNKNDVARPFLNLNQPGGTIGGPIIKDKLLFFANYEAYRNRQQSPTTNTILTPTARQGILQYRTASGIQTFDVLKAAGLGIDPAVQALLAQVPTTGNNSQVGDQLNTTGYTFNARANNTRDNVTGKVDYYLSTKNALSGSYLFNRDIVDRPDFTGSGTFYTAVPPVYNDNHAHFMSASWRWSPTPTITNELRGGFDLQTGTFVNRAPAPAYYLTGLSFSAPATQPTPEQRNTNVYSIQDNANWVKGRHSFAFGFQASLWHTKDSLFTGVIPSYGLGISASNSSGFTSIPGGTSSDVTIANNLLATLGGIVSTSVQTFNPASRTSGFVSGAPQAALLNLNNLAPYFRDSWKIRHNLTLTLGLRWEYFGPVDITNGLMIEPQAPKGNASAALLGNATLDFAPNPLYKRDLNNFGPSIGFAWDVFGDGKTAIRSAYSIAYANDNLINDIPNTIFYGVNNGLNTTVTTNNLNAIVSRNLPAIPTPSFALPRTTEDNFNTSPSSPPAQGLVDPNLATPYVQQWNLSISHDFKGFVVEGRYVGNHVVKQLREIDFNQVNINQSTYLPDFIAARNNGFLALAARGVFDPRFNAAIAGSKPLPFFDQLPSGGILTNATVSSAIRSGQAGSLAQTYQNFGFLPNDNFSFFPNQFALFSGLLTNISNSSYNGLQVEVRKHTRNGMQFQANYTFSKSLSDALTTRGLEAQLDNSNGGIERARTPFDITHSFKLNHFVPLPFGPGRRFDMRNGLLNRLVGGWGLGGFLRIESGFPVSILSARGTLNRAARSGNNTVDTTLTLDELKKITGVFMTGNGPYWINPKNINPTNGQGVAPDGSPAFAGQVFFNPQPGSVGSLQRRILDGPRFWMYDASLIKNTKITERQSIEFRADFFNLFNHPNFFLNSPNNVPDQNVNNSSFGQITVMNSTNPGVSSRVAQFGLMYRF